MVEKTLVAVNFRFVYSGSFSIHGLYDLVDKWAEEHHYHKEIKDHAEHHRPDGRELHYSIELWKQINYQVVAIVRFTLDAKRVRDATITVDSPSARYAITVDATTGHVALERVAAGPAAG